VTLTSIYYIDETCASINTRKEEIEPVACDSSELQHPYWGEGSKV
jgi:hypothetical protein